MAREAQTAKSNSRRFIAVDPGKCTGCGICEYVCALEKSEALWNPLTSRIRVLRLHPLLNVAMACRFCEDARCVTACPEKALVQSEANGVLIVDERKCKGCDWCIQACPHGGLALHPDKGLVMACDLCGGEPKCVDSCPEEALELVSDDTAAERKWNAAIEKLPSEVEKFANVLKKKEWSLVLAEAEERATRTSEKLEAISRRERSSDRSIDRSESLKELIDRSDLSLLIPSEAQEIKALIRREDPSIRTDLRKKGFQQINSPLDLRLCESQTGQITEVIKNLRIRGKRLSDEDANRISSEFVRNAKRLADLAL